jgi:hypothetical protein
VRSATVHNLVVTGAQVFETCAAPDFAALGVNADVLPAGASVLMGLVVTAAGPSGKRLRRLDIDSVIRKSSELHGFIGGSYLDLR